MEPGRKVMVEDLSDVQRTNYTGVGAEIIRLRDQRDRLREKVIRLSHRHWEGRPTAEEIESWDTDPEMALLIENGQVLLWGDMTDEGELS